MTALLIITSIMCGWIMLTLLGSERQRQLTIEEIHRRVEQRRHDAIAAAAKAAGSPHGAPAVKPAEH